MGGGFADQGRLPIVDYIAANRFADRLAVFVHIPKTAGSSLSTELATLRPPYFNIHRRYTMGDPVTFTRIEDEIQAFVARDATVARACSGHFPYARAAPIRARRPDAAFFTFVRDPVARVISDYRYARTPTHPTYKAFIEQFPDFDSFLAAPQSRDKIARFLLPKRLVDEAEIEQFLDRHFAFIGTVEHYALSFDILTRLMDCPRPAVEHKRVTEDTADNALSVDDDLRARIAAVNRRDAIIHRIVSARLDRMAQTWTAPPPP